MSEPKKVDWPIVVGVVLLMLTALGGYVGCYFALSTRNQFAIMERTGPSIVIYRTFATQWQEWFFYPAVQVEGVLSGKRVEIGPIETTGEAAE